MTLFHNLNLAFRNLKKASIVRITRYASAIIGIVCTVAIVVYVYHEFTTDRFHAKSENIYAFLRKDGSLTNWRAGELALEYKNSFPQIRQIVNVKEYSGENVRISYESGKYVTNGFVVDSTFFDVFDFETEQGNPQKIIRDPQSIIISRNLAEIIFGRDDPIGKIINVNLEHPVDYIVRGILKDLPTNCSMNFDFLVPMHSASRNFSIMGLTFVVSDSPPDNKLVSDLNEKSKSKYANSEDWLSSFIPFTEIYFNNENIQFYRVFAKKGNKRNLFILSIIAAILLTVSLLNCIGLIISEVLEQRKKLAINKLCGASPASYFVKTVSEFIVDLIIVVFCSALLFFVLKKGFGSLLNLHLDMHPAFILSLVFSVSTVLLFITHFWALLLTARMNLFNTLNAEVQNNRHMYSRKWLTVVQFVLAILLINSSIIVHKQYRAMLDKDLGFDPENVIKTRFFNTETFYESYEKAMEERQKREKDFQYLTDQLNSNPNIISYGRGSLLNAYPMSFKRTGTDDEFETENIITVSPGYEAALGLKMAEGRFFDPEKDLSRGDAIVINEAAKKKFNITDISTDRLKNKSWNYKDSGSKIIGIVKDFNYEHLASNIKPLVIYYFNDIEEEFLIKIRKGKEQETIQFLSELNAKINPGLAFSYSFLSDEIRQMYSNEKQLGRLYLILTLITIFISLSGLLAFVFSLLQKRIKEIGIRKVNGAKVNEILTLLNKDFVKWVAIAFVVATPVAYYTMNKWLQNFAYKTALSWWIFALAGLMALGIALLTVSWQSWRAARKNPVEALRYE